MICDCERVLGGDHTTVPQMALGDKISLLLLPHSVVAKGGLEVFVWILAALHFALTYYAGLKKSYPVFYIFGNKNVDLLRF